MQRDEIREALLAHVRKDAGAVSAPQGVVADLEDLAAALKVIAARRPVSTSSTTSAEPATRWARSAGRRSRG